MNPRMSSHLDPAAAGNRQTPARFLPMLLLALVLIALGGAAVQAQGGATAEQLRASGAAGERWDGLMEARDPSAQADVAAINERRMELYRERAGAQDVPWEDVGMVYFEQIFATLPSGTWIKGTDNVWGQKP
jgi:uncharacterized protein